MSNALKRLGFQSHNFLTQLLSEISRACTIRVRRSTLGRLWNELGSHAGLHHRHRRSRTPLRNEYLAAENRILKAQVKGRLLLSAADKATLAEIAHRLGRKALEEVAATAMPDTILGWYRKLVANKFDGSRFRHSAGRPRVDAETEGLVVQIPTENAAWRN